MMQVSRLFAITDVAGRGERETVSMVRRICQARPLSVSVILRERALGVTEQIRLGRRLQQIIAAAGQQLLVADRLDVCELVGAAGVHLGGGAVAPEVLREYWGSRQAYVISRGWHEGEKTPEAVDAVLISPAVSPRKGRAVLKAGRFSAVCSEIRRAGSAPIALGGVAADNCADLVALGAHGVACIGSAYTESEHMLTSLGISIEA